MTLLLALDPGETTGWSLWYYDGVTALRAVEHGMQSGGTLGFIYLMHKLEGRFDEVVCESFILDGRTAAPNVTPLRIEGALTALWDGPTTLQRNVYKRHAPDDLLKRAGLWRRSSRISGMESIIYLSYALRQMVHESSPSNRQHP